MIMDTLAGLAFAYESPSLEYMKEKSKPKNVSIINYYMYGKYYLRGFILLYCV